MLIEKKPISISLKIFILQMDSQSNIENVPVPVPVSVPTPVTDVPELDDVSLEVPTELVGSVEDPEADKENSPENEEDRDENVSKILNRNYYQIAHDLQQHDGGGGKIIII